MADGSGGAGGFAVVHLSAGSAKAGTQGAGGRLMPEEFRGKQVLITGGLGFLGSNLAIRLVQSEARVTLLDSLVPEYGGNLHNIAGVEDHLRVNISDVRDAYSMRHLVRGQDYLFNL